MSAVPGYLAKNLDAWNKRTEYHIDSAFYNNEKFKQGASSLKEPELYLLGNVNGKKILHLQCHFGQDTISLSRLGAHTTGIDLSDTAISYAEKLAKETNSEARFICCNIYDLPAHFDETFDIVFTSYGTIGWLPDLDKWAQIVSHFLKPGGRFVFVEFHPFVWMYDDAFSKISYNYFNVEPIIEKTEGTYAFTDAPIITETVSWNHSLSEVINSLIHNGLKINSFDEYNYSPYNCFKETVEFELGKFRIRHFNDMIPMMYSISAVK